MMFSEPHWKKFLIYTPMNGWIVRSKIHIRIMNVRYSHGREKLRIRNEIIPCRRL